MSIQIDKIQQHPTDDYQWLWITVNDVAGDVCKYVTCQPHNNEPSGILSGDALQSYVDEREGVYKEKILRIMYETAVVPILDFTNPLGNFEAWVSDGCTNAEVRGLDLTGNAVVIKASEVITKKIWEDSH